MMGLGIVSTTAEGRAMSEPWPSDEHLINVLTIRGEFIATSRCGWKHSSDNMKEHIGLGKGYSKVRATPHRSQRGPEVKHVAPESRRSAPISLAACSTQ
jgi:hypothetical protein